MPKGSILVADDEVEIREGPRTHFWNPKAIA